MDNVSDEALSGSSPSSAPGQGSAVVNEKVAADTQKAMTLLHWELRDLFINTFAYGNAGTEADVAEHLRTGDHVTPAQAAVIQAALNDALRGINSPFRV